MTQRILVADTETTGFGKEDDICEVAFVEITEDLDVVNSFASLVKPKVPISPGASDANNITNEMLADALPMHAALSSAGFDSAYFQDVFLIAHNCVTGDHEVRTREGWLEFSVLTEDTEMLQWDPATAEISFTKFKLLETEYKGDLLCWNTSFHKGIYTPDHRIFSRRATNPPPEWDVITAAELASIAPNYRAIPVSGFYSPDRLDLTPLEARALEMIRADGNISETTTNYYVRFAFKKRRKITRCTHLLDTLGVSYRTTLRDDGATIIRTHKNPIVTKLCGLLGAGPNKGYGLWALDMSLRAKRAILAELVYWDGSKLDGRKAHTAVYSAKKADVEILADIAVTSGFCAKVTFNIANNRGFSKEGSVIHKVVIRPRAQVKTLLPPEITPFEGKVFCATVPTGAFLVRRGGAIWVTGNCRFDMRFLKPYWSVTGAACTMKGARQCWPHAPNHKLQTLRHFLGIDLDVGEAHRALADVLVTVELLKNILDVRDMTLAEWVESVEDPTRITHMPWGKYKGKLLDELPVSYINWLLALPDLDEDLAVALEKLICR